VPSKSLLKNAKNRLLARAAQKASHVFATGYRAVTARERLLPILFQQAPNRSRDERGSALLIVFVFAAIVAIMLYKAIPDAVFEGQRQKEQILMDRGNEYKTAIKRFLKRNQRYPTALDQLDNFNSQRYIRRRYKDPMTGQDEWRLIHVMTPGFVLTDSKVTPLKPNGANGMNGTNGTNGANGANGTNGVQSGAGGFAQTNSSGFGNNSFGSSSFGSSNTSNSTFGSSQPHDPDVDPNAPPAPTAAQLYGAQRRPAAAPSENMPGDQNANPDQLQADGALPLPAPAPVQSAGGVAQPGAPAQGANPNAPNNAGAGAGNADPNNPAASALKAVNGAMRQQGPTPTAFAKSSAFGGTISGGGIAGVASKAKGSSIKVMDGQTDYSKWEFVYNPQKDAAAGLQGAANRMNTNANSPQNSGNSSAGFSNQKSGFGSNSSSGFGSNSSSGFGSSSSGFGSNSSSGFGSSSSGFGSNSSGFGSNSSGFGSSSHQQPRQQPQTQQMQQIQPSQQ
jgi:hypothetical protein